jgi:hypothetical protein
MRRLLVCFRGADIRKPLLTQRILQVKRSGGQHFDILRVAAYGKTKLGTMNRFDRRGVLLHMACTALLGLAGGCVEVDGGAVEVGWDLRFPDGRRTDDNGDSISCSRAQLGDMALVLSPVGGGDDPCSGVGHCRFSCSPQGVGTTDFVLPPGDYAMALQVLDPSGKALGVGDGILTPGSMVRRIILGEITNLSVHLIIVDR